MGCGSSRLDDNGDVLPAKARPLFLLRLEEITRQKRPKALRDSTPSKKELLLEDKEDDEIVTTTQPLLNKSGKHLPLQEETRSCVTSEGSKQGSPERVSDNSNKDVKSKEETSTEKGKDEEQEGPINKALAKDDNNEAKVEHILDGDIKNEEEGDEEEEEDDEDDGRILRHHKDDEVFPGSPSFRVFFIDNTSKKDNGVYDDLTDMAPIGDDPVPLKEPVTGEVKKGKKRRSFKKVLPTGRQAKNLFNVRSCISSTHSSHDRTHLLAAKPHS